MRAAAVRATAAMKAKDAPPLTRPDKNIIQNLHYIIDVVQNLDYVYFTAAGAWNMAKLHQIGKVIITIYANDHLPPHFHVIAPDFEALIEIETLAVLAGSLGRSSRKAVMTWVAANLATIRAEWNRINPRFPTK